MAAQARSANSTLAKNSALSDTGIAAKVPRHAERASAPTRSEHRASAYIPRKAGAAMVAQFSPRAASGKTSKAATAASGTSRA